MRAFIGLSTALATLAGIGEAAAQERFDTEWACESSDEERREITVRHSAGTGSRLGVWYQQAGLSSENEGAWSENICWINFVVSSRFHSHRCVENGSEIISRARIDDGQWVETLIFDRDRGHIRKLDPDPSGQARTRWTLYTCEVISR